MSQDTEVEALTLVEAAVQSACNNLILAEALLEACVDELESSSAQEVGKALIRIQQAIELIETEFELGDEEETEEDE